MSRLLPLYLSQKNSRLSNASVYVCLRNQMRSRGSYSPQEPLEYCTTRKSHTRHTSITTRRLDYTWIRASLERQREEERKRGGKERNLPSVFHLYPSFFLPLGVILCQKRSDLKIKSRCDHRLKKHVSYQTEHDIITFEVSSSAPGLSLPGPLTPTPPPELTEALRLISRASHFVSHWSCQRSDKPWEIFTLSQRKSSQPLGQREKGGGTVWKTDEEEDRLILQGVNQKMRGRDGEKGEEEEGERRRKAEIPSSGFFIKASGES